MVARSDENLRVDLGMKRNRTTRLFLVAALVSALRLIHAQEQAPDLSNPTALAFDHSGNLFAASYPNTILKFTADGTKSTFASDVFGSSGLVFDKAGDLFALGADSNSIVKFAADGTKSIFATGIRNPQGLGCDSAGNLFVSEVGTESILRFTPNATRSTFVTGISVPRNIAFDGSGNLFVYDASANAIFKISPDGARSEFAGGFSASCLTLDKAGNLLVGDIKSQSIIKFAPNGSKSSFVDGIPAPGGLAFDKDGNLFVSDQSTDSILKFAPDGARTVFYKASSQPSAVAEEEEEEGGGEKDSSAGLPAKYARDYLIAAQTVSPDKKFAVIYPNEAMADAASAKGTEMKDYLVTLEPFSVLKPLDTKSPHFEHESNGGLSAEWSNDSSVGLIALDSKWGPGDVLLVELHNGKLVRMTNVLRKAHDLLAPNWRKAKAERYSDYNDFVFLDATFKLDGTNRVVVEANADTTPNDLGLSHRAWHGYVAAIWDIPHAKFTSANVSGHRRKQRGPEPDEAAMYRSRGETDVADRGDFERAIADYTRAIELYPKYGEAYRGRGLARESKRDPDLDGATADLDRAIELDPEDVAAYAGRADVEAKRKQYAAAIKDIQKAIDSDLVKGHYYVDLAWYQLLNRNPREAIAASRKALEWSPSDAVTINANLAHAYLFDNQFDKAKAIYLENKDAKLDNQRTFRQAVLDDFKELQQAGISHPDMEKIKALLTNKPETK